MNQNMRKYAELSEKERFLKEIVESARLMVEKRELFRKILSNQERGILQTGEFAYC